MSGGGGVGGLIEGWADVATLGMGDQLGITGEDGLIGSLTGASAAKYQGRIAEAQLAEQRRTRELATAAAEPSPAELAQMQQSISLNEQDIARKQKLIESADPALIEAGKQALGLLQGKNAKSLAPLQAQRQQQRQALQQRLKAQLGPGYETTTAGQQALAQFDQSSALANADVQQQTLGQLLGVAQNTANNYGMQSNIGNAATLSQLYGNQSTRRVSAINATPITAAGAENVAGLQRAQGLTNLINQGVKLGGMAAGYGG
jgi:hypothetical protein